jgi:hypothetical protein
LAQAFVDRIAAIEVRVVDQPLPTDDGARLLEVHPHHDAKVIAILVRGAAQAARVLEPRFGMMNRARTHDDHQPVGLPAQNLGHLASTLCHYSAGFGMGGNLLHEDRWRQKRSKILDANVVSRIQHAVSASQLSRGL